MTSTTALRYIASIRAQLLGTLLLLLLLCPATAWAQGIRGVVLDAETNQPVNAATVALLDFREEVVRSVITDARGAFVIRVGETGRFYLRAERIGYATVTSRPLDLLPGDTAVVELRMGVEALAIEPLTVTASTRTLRNRDLDDFYQRRRYVHLGGAAFYGPEDLAEMRAAQIPDLLGAAPGVRVLVDYPGWGSAPRIQFPRSGGRPPCTPGVFVDGFELPISDGGQAMSEIAHPDDLRAARAAGRQPVAPNPAPFVHDNLNDYVTNMNVLAIEMYRGHAVPGELFICKDPKRCTCGVINILTNRGQEEDETTPASPHGRRLWAVAGGLAVLLTIFVGR
jgi:hypothetical protein